MARLRLPPSSFETEKFPPKIVFSLSPLPSLKISIVFPISRRVEKKKKRRRNREIFPTDRIEKLTLRPAMSRNNIYFHIYKYIYIYTHTHTHIGFINGGANIGGKITRSRSVLTDSVCNATLCVVRIFRRAAWKTIFRRICQSSNILTGARGRGRQTFELLKTVG